MLDFNCEHCRRRLRLDESRAGKKCRCGHCKKVVEAPQLAAPQLARVIESIAPGTSVPDIAPVVISLAPGESRPVAARLAAVNRPMAGPSGTVAELFDFLAPAQGPGEMGRLAGYRVLKVLGSGGMGVVFQAEDLQLKRAVALKVMLPGVAASPENRQRFLQEAQAAAAIEHDHIVTIYQVGEDRRVPFIAMQLLKGESLEDRLQREGCLNGGEALRIAEQIAAGLAVAHERGLIHRDIKPANIWLESVIHSPSSVPGTTDVRVKILDFGLARLVGGDVNLTKSGAIMGSPAYMAPEQTRAQKLDSRCDLFSLGCVLYRMCTGRLPFPGTDTIAVLIAVANEDPPYPHRVNPQVPARLSRLIMNLLAKDPAARLPSARAVIERIHELRRELHSELAVGAEPVSSFPHQAIPAAPTPESQTSIFSQMFQRTTPAVQAGRRKWVLALVGGGLAVVIGIVAIVLASGGRDPASHDPASHDPASRDPASREPASGEPASRDSASRDSDNRTPQETAAVNPKLPPRKLFAKGARRFLADLQEFDVQAGKWPFRKRECGDGKPIQVAGVLSKNGLGMHPPFGPSFAVAKYHLRKEAELFKATVAINDTTKWCWSPATFIVLGDGKELWRSNWIAHNYAQKQDCQIVVKGVDVLELRVRVENGNDGVHAVWVEPRVLRKIDSPDDPG